MLQGRGIVVSYPKAGRTCLHLMLNRANIEAHFTHLGATLSARKNVADLKVELPFPGRLVALIRDPRDIVVSSYHHATRVKSLIDVPLELFIRDPLFGIEKPAQFNMMLADYCGAHHGTMLVTYEELSHDTAATLERIAQFLRRPIRPEVAAGIAQKCSFATMQDEERSGLLAGTLGRSFTRADGKDINTFRVRRGKVGGFRDELSPADLAYVDGVLTQLDYFGRLEAARRRIMERKASWGASASGH